MVDLDVLVVGAGTAGAAAAALCAERGLSVLCVDRRPLEEAGARWLNGVPVWCFDEAGIERPAEPEHHTACEGSFRLVAGWGPTSLELHPEGVIDVDMRLLVARLQALAVANGAVLRGSAELRNEERGLRLDGAAVSPRYVIDASGLSGACLLGSPRVAAEHLCAAAQRVFEVRDRGAALQWFRSHGARLGDTVCFSAIAGGYSILNARSDGTELSLLTGSIPAHGHPSGSALMREFTRSQAWIGDPGQGGARAIPLRRPFDRLGTGSVAAIGDAACQVFSAHGSGVGIGLVAARVLSDALADGSGPWGYSVAFHRRWGGLLAAYDLFRRFSERLTPADLAAMMRTGMMDEETSAQALGQQMPALPWAKLPGKAVSFARNPRMAAAMTRVGLRMVRLRRHYARYPASPDALPAWSARVAALAADQPDEPSATAPYRYGSDSSIR